MASQSLIAKRSQRPFPFMELPPELRLLAYEFSFQDTVDAIVSAPYSTRALAHSRKPQFLGAVALVHTSKLIGAESIDIVKTLASIHWSALEVLLTQATDVLEAIQQADILVVSSLGLGWDWSQMRHQVFTPVLEQLEAVAMAFDSDLCTSQVVSVANRQVWSMAEVYILLSRISHHRKVALGRVTRS